MKDETQAGTQHNLALRGRFPGLPEERLSSVDECMTSVTPLDCSPDAPWEAGEIRSLMHASAGRTKILNTAASW